MRKRREIKPLVGEVEDMSFHRNGISGEGFWTILFKGHEDADSTIKGQRFLATVASKTDGPGEDDIHTRVHRLSDLVDGDAGNAWRGDNFHDELTVLVKNYVWPHEREEKECGGVVEFEPETAHEKDIAAHTPAVTIEPEEEDEG